MCTNSSKNLNNILSRTEHAIKGLEHHKMRGKAKLQVKRGNFDTTTFTNSRWEG